MLSRIKEKLDLKKPFAMGFGEWDEWHSETKKNRPIAYFIMETIPDAWNDTIRLISNPWYKSRDWIRYRIFDRYHVINTGLRPGYHEADERMMNGMFSLLVDFVEVESAWMHVVFDEKEKRRRKVPWWNLGWTRFKSFRDPEAGLAHLKWEMTLDGEHLAPSERNPYQAERAREVWELYHWWKSIRPRRPDPDDVAGWSEYCSNKTLTDLFGNNVSKEDQQARSKIIEDVRNIEDAYDAEDDQMLIRLAKIRRSLWT